MAGKNEKAAGPDEIPMKLVKLTDEDNIEIILVLFNKIYNIVLISEEWMILPFVTFKHQRKKSQKNARFFV